MADRYRIVVVGGGVAGAEIATYLGRTLGRRGEAEVTLVDRSLSHVWKPMLHTIAAGTARPEQQTMSLLAQAKARDFRFWPGSLAGVDRVGRRVLLAPFDTQSPAAVDERQTASLPYDALILAVGSRANDFGTPGVAEHCLSIDDLGQAETFHRRLRHHVFASLGTDRPLGIAIVGGGATGVELAAELKRSVDLAAGYGPEILRTKLRLSLIESGPRILPAFPERISGAALQALTDLGVDVRTGAMVTGADPDGFVLKGGGRIEAGLKVWAAGVKAPDVLASIDGLPRTRTGQLVVGPTLQTEDPAVFALGDCASLTDPATGGTVPATAQAARQQARHLSRHFAEWRRSGAMPAFRYRDRGALVSLADYNGWGTLGRYTFGGGHLRGLTARLAHALLFRQHQIELFGLVRGMLAWLADGLDRLVRPPVRLD